MSVKEESMSDMDDEIYLERTIKREPMSTEFEDQCSYSLIKVEKDNEDDAATVSTHDGHEYIKLEELECSETDVPVKVEIEIGPTVIQTQYIGSSLHTTDASKAELIQCGGADVTLGTTTPGAALYSAYYTNRPIVHGGTYEQKQFSCNICQYNCMDKSKIIRHMRTHTGEKPFSCPICEYKCTVKSNLVKHVRIHTGEKPFFCNICDYKCTVKSSLVKHLRTHTGEKPYSCNICEYKCTVQSSLVKHMRTHTGEKPYSCNFCEYKCTVQSSLVKHMLTHTGEKPYSCNICEYKCTVKSSLVKHMRNRH